MNEKKQSEEKRKSMLRVREATHSNQPFSTVSQVRGFVCQWLRQRIQHVLGLHL